MKERNQPLSEMGISNAGDVKKNEYTREKWCEECSRTLPYGYGFSWCPYCIHRSEKDVKIRN